MPFDSWAGRSLYAPAEPAEVYLGPAKIFGLQNLEKMFLVLALVGYSLIPDTGIEDTTRKNFGGGNTDWEERRLSKYEFSETRLVEIIESLCQNSEFECNLMVETNEEYIENWWFNMQKKNPNLFLWFCVDTIKVCCPAGSYGPDCIGCPGGADRPCNEHGSCDGDGTRTGDGSCSCTKEYEGAECLDCTEGYYSEFQNETHSICTACHPGCKTCIGPSNSHCTICASGWVEEDSDTVPDGVVCLDVDECAENSPCEQHQYCSNTEGSYLCKVCNDVCDSCTSEGADKCINCTTGYTMEEATCVDINECSLTVMVCTQENEACINTEGSYKCVCAEGYEDRDGLCVEGKVPEDVEHSEGRQTMEDETATDVNPHEDL
ncbi:cysteine-rich with EGF-like domain protein 2 isoform X1 [Callorhinchus milii]|nr:cysteine-rich with EGF-like domain protein 2 isoform X1 [Callorhinchus milii]|eukprot:gi/632947676/ref/XP_007889169.1/ PREDICTED: cysteine-rich with EGF-like domain protein 2 isoform X1 [Callorhinchus milii]